MIHGQSNSHWRSCTKITQHKKKLFARLYGPTIKWCKFELCLNHTDNSIRQQLSWGLGWLVGFMSFFSVLSRCFKLLFACNDSHFVGIRKNFVEYFFKKPHNFPQKSVLACALISYSRRILFTEPDLYVLQQHLLSSKFMICSQFMRHFFLLISTLQNETIKWEKEKKPTETHWFNYESFLSSARNPIRIVSFLARVAAHTTMIATMLDGMRRSQSLVSYHRHRQWQKI